MYDTWLYHWPVFRYLKQIAVFLIRLMSPKTSIRWALDRYIVATEKNRKWIFLPIGSQNCFSLNFLCMAWSFESKKQTKNLYFSCNPSSPYLCKPDGIHPIANKNTFYQYVHYIMIDNRNWQYIWLAIRKLNWNYLCF